MCVHFIPTGGFLFGPHEKSPWVNLTLFNHTKGQIPRHHRFFFIYTTNILNKYVCKHVTLGGSAVQWAAVQVWDYWRAFASLPLGFHQRPDWTVRQHFLLSRLFCMASWKLASLHLSKQSLHKSPAFECTLFTSQVSWRWWSGFCKKPGWLESKGKSRSASLLSQILVLLWMRSAPPAHFSVDEIVQKQRDHFSKKKRSNNYIF